MDNSADSIKARIPNRYSLVVLAAKRAKQLKEGAPALIQSDNPNALSVALEEIAAGKINYIAGAEIEDDEAPVRPEPVVAAAPVTKESAAMQMLTASLDQAEKANEASSGEGEGEGEVADEDVAAVSADAPELELANAGSATGPASEEG
jgi:DNA-directed RNA polymerase subunit omega